MISRSLISSRQIALEVNLRIKDGRVSTLEHKLAAARSAVGEAFARCVSAGSSSTGHGPSESTTACVQIVHRAEGAEQEAQGLKRWRDEYRAKMEKHESAVGEVSESNIEIRWYTSRVFATIHGGIAMYPDASARAARRRM